MTRPFPAGVRLGAGALGRVARSTSLRRAQLSFGLTWTAEWALIVALGVFAFRNGGAAAVGAVTAVRMIPAALLTPFAATMADAVRRELVLALIGLVRAVTLGAAAVLLGAGGSTAVLYGLAIVATIAQTLYRPAHSALLPALCTTPQELTSANVVRGMLDAIAALAGPLVATVLLTTSGLASVFAVCAVASLVAGLVVLALPYDLPPRAPRPARTGARAVLQGFSTISAERGILLITGLGIALWGVPLVLLGVVPEVPAAIALFAVVGIGNAFIDVGGFTMLARLADESVLARMFAAFEAILTVGIAVGALLTPLMIDILGIRLALVAVGLVTPLAVVGCRPALRRLDARLRVRDADIELLHHVPMLRVLPQATIEQLAAALDHAEIAPGHAVFAQGDPGERFYVVEAGSAEVVRDGRTVNTLRRGECFGEIALLRDCVRTAGVSASATTPLRVSMLPRTPFLTAVTGFPASAVAGERVVTARLEGLVSPEPSGGDTG